MSLDIEIWGELCLRRNGAVVELPQSRKTRALFAYLLLERRPLRREHLCEVFWDVPDDPRGSLRWSLSKIRRMLGIDAAWLVADRERVELAVPDAAVDVFRDDRPPGERTLLEGIDLPNNDRFTLWLTDARRRAEQGALGVQSQVAVASGPPPPGQTVRYTTAADGTRIAYACTGEGPPLLKAANWLSHLDLDLESPAWGQMVVDLSRDHELVRYDERGNGLSDWEVEDLSFEAFVRDLETVADTLELERFPLIGISQGCAVGIEYVCRHPGRVSALVLVGGYAAGWRVLGDTDLAEQRAAAITLVRHGWGENNPAYRQIFSHSFFPQASAEEIDWFNEFQRRTTSAENAARYLEVFADIDVRARLQQVSMPTLVIHSREDQRVALEMGLDLAATIPDAALVTLDSASHVPMSSEPAFAVMMARIREFLAAHAEQGGGRP